MDRTSINQQERNAKDVAERRGIPHQMAGANTTIMRRARFCLRLLGAVLGLAMLRPSPIFGKCAKNWELTLIGVEEIGAGEPESTGTGRDGTLDSEDTGGSGSGEVEAWPLSLEFSGDSPEGLAIIGDEVWLLLERTSSRSVSGMGAVSP